MSIVVHPDVDGALRSKRGVVALETAALTHGLPRGALGRQPRGTSAWKPSEPANLQTLQAMEAAVRAAGAVPATVAILDGKLHVGLTSAQLARLAADEQAQKAAVADMACAMGSGACAGTTVSATMMACSIATSQPIRVFATGGIGGVHRAWHEHPDISADLIQLSSTPMCVVSSGAKAILDLPATLEALDTFGVTVLGYQTDEFAQFYSRAGNGPRLRYRVDSAEDVATICAMQWTTLKRRAAVLVSNPLPAELGIDPKEIETAVAAAEEEARSRGIAGPQRTPLLLRSVSQRTGGRTLDANIALLVANARLAGEIACQLARV
jgi:pseudouridine-5'-phosphate glycosidase